MREAKVKKVNPRKKDDYIAQLFIGMLLMMVNNINFPTLAIQLTAIQTALDDYLAALSACVTKTAGTAAFKNQKKDIVVTLVNALIDDINQICKGDLAKLQTVGLPVYNGEVFRRILGLIEKFSVVHGKNSGDAILTVKADNGDGGMFSYTSFPVTENSAWISEPCKEMTCILKNLPVGEKLVFQARIVGSFGQYAITQQQSLIII